MYLSVIYIADDEVFDHLEVYSFLDQKGYATYKKRSVRTIWWERVCFFFIRSHGTKCSSESFERHSVALIPAVSLKSRVSHSIAFKIFGIADCRQRCAYEMNTTSEKERVQLHISFR